MLTTSVAQIGNKGVPGITNYPYDQYQAGAQNWSILQDQKGHMLFGNNYGLLEYDGRTWHLVTQPHNKTVVRSLHEGRDGRLYLGAQHEFGYVKANDAGQKRYVSLLHKVPADKRHFSDVWAIFETSNGIFFHTSQAIYQYQSDTIHVIETPPINGFSKIADSILVQDDSRSIHVVKPNGLKKLIDAKRIDHYILKMYDDHRGNLQVVTQQNGIYVFSGAHLQNRKVVSNGFFTSHKVQSVHKLRGDYLVIGSVDAGLLIMDNDYQPIQWLRKDNGLQSNTILSMGTDHLGNLWAATETGIDYVHIANPLYHIADNFNLEGTVSSTVLHDQVLYVGTNTGVFRSPWLVQENPIHPTLGFRQIPDLSGQAWKIYVIADQVYVCHHEGLFALKNNKPHKISPGLGVWNLMRSAGDSNIYLSGAYDGIHLYELRNDRLQYLRKLKNFEETSRILESDDRGYLWMAHGYKGLFKLKLDDDLTAVVDSKLYTEAHGLPTFWFNNLFKIQGQIRFGTEKGTYRYDPETDLMVPDPIYAEILGNDDHVRLMQEEQNKVWFIKGPDMNDSMGIIEFYDDKFEITSAPLQWLRGKFNPGFENINIIDDKTVLFGTKKGIVLFNRNMRNSYTSTYSSRVTDVKNLVTDSVMYGQLFIDDRSEIADLVGTYQLPFDQNSISISYGSNYYESNQDTRYSYFLEGFDQGWYEWESHQTKSYTNLPAGAYTFHVKAKNVYGMESLTDSYKFEILQPWYWTTYAKVGYLALGMLCVIGLLRFYKYRIERAQEIERETQQEVLRRNKAKFQEEKLLTEKELIALRNEKLEAEIEISRSKMDVLNAEMAASIMMITQKNGVLMRVSEDLAHLHKKAKDSNKELIESVIKMINKDINTDQDWEQFKIHFDKVHEDFLERLKCQFPEVTAKDLQLAAYLRLNLSSKEIASMMNITLRSVEGCRYRLRKHLNLNGQTNLSDFILKF